MPDLDRLRVAVKKSGPFVSACCLCLSSFVLLSFSLSLSLSPRLARFVGREGVPQKKAVLCYIPPIVFEQDCSRSRYFERRKNSPHGDYIIIIVLRPKKGEQLKFETI